MLCSDCMQKKPHLSASHESSISIQIHKLFEVRNHASIPEPEKFKGYGTDHSLKRITEMYVLNGPFKNPQQVTSDIPA